ncbi:SMC-Scp complex subunit ScpB [Candidatus Parcubacteria bacterium]|nr:SMC-Scp complex subunit ScpB [Candidatus Parcubacteria bacterium]
MSLDAQIEAILFWKGEPLKIEKLAAILHKTEEEIKEGLTALGQKLEGRGLQLIFKDEEVMMSTRSDMGSLIEKLIKEELVKDLGKAGLETLSIILYRGPIVRRDIDYIRGVNSNFILRNLLIRGLVEKVTNPKDERSFLYKPTFELLSFLGISSIEELPEYTEVRREIETHEHAQQSHE